MATGDPLDKPWLSTDDWCSFQLGQCRLHIHLKRTKEFYASQPKISENCLCGYCKYFESEVINQPHSLFDILRKMEVDLSRQPNINPDGISCVGETKPGKLGYMGNYFVFGEIGKTSKKGKNLRADGSVNEVTFNDMEFGAGTTVTVKQVEEGKLSFSFYMDVDKTAEI
ncbi:MAG TPA: hypothetical protein VNS58_02390 [Puia sp.]|nr:hypothetical protein [Puia sp.]